MSATVNTYLHLKHRSEPRLPALHIVKRFLSLRERNLLHHALETVELREADRFLAVKRVSRWPAVDRQPLLEESRAIDGDVTRR